MVGALATVIGVTLLVSREVGVNASLPVLALGSALAFLVVDVVYYFRRVIGAVYLADAALQVGFMAAWIYVALTAPY